MYNLTTNQPCLPFWNDVIDKKQLRIKELKAERRNEWIRKNLGEYNRDFEESNIKGLIK